MIDYLICLEPDGTSLVGALARAYGSPSNGVGSAMGRPLCQSIKLDKQRRHSLLSAVFPATCLGRAHKTGRSMPDPARVHVPIPMLAASARARKPFNGEVIGAAF
jgi:hypothetical protein